MALLIDLEPEEVSMKIKQERQTKTKIKEEPAVNNSCSSESHAKQEYVVGILNFFKGDEETKIRELAHFILEPEEIIDVFVYKEKEKSFSFIKVSSEAALAKILKLSALVIEGKTFQVRKYKLLDLKDMLLPAADNSKPDEIRIKTEEVEFETGFLSTSIEKKEKQFFVCLYMLNLPKNTVEIRFRNIVQSVLSPEIDDIFLLIDDYNSFGFLKTSSEEIFQDFFNFDEVLIKPNGVMRVREIKIINPKSKPEISNLSQKLLEFGNLNILKKRKLEEDRVEGSTPKRLREENGVRNENVYVAGFLNFRKGSGTLEGNRKLIHTFLNEEEILDFFIYKDRSVHFGFVKVPSKTALSKIMKLRRWTVNREPLEIRVYKFIDMKTIIPVSNNDLEHKNGIQKVKEKKPHLACMYMINLGRGTEEDFFKKCVKSILCPEILDLFFIKGKINSFGYIKTESKVVLKKFLNFGEPSVNNGVIIDVQEVEIIDVKEKPKILPKLDDLTRKYRNIILPNEKKWRSVKNGLSKKLEDETVDETAVMNTSFKETYRYTAALLNLEEGATDDELKSFIHTIVPPEDVILIMRLKSGRSAFVYFSSEESLQKALSVEKYHFKGRDVVIREPIDRPTKRLNSALENRSRGKKQGKWYII